MDFEKSDMWSIPIYCCWICAWCPHINSTEPVISFLCYIYLFACFARARLWISSYAIAHVKGPSREGLSSLSSALCNRQSNMSVNNWKTNRKYSSVIIYLAWIMPVNFNSQIHVYLLAKRMSADVRPFWTWIYSDLMYQFKKK